MEVSCCGRGRRGSCVDPRADAPPFPGRRARLLARVRHAGLDRALARGDDPSSSPALAARAAALSALEPRLSVRP
jgi:hypothetical protein